MDTLRTHKPASLLALLVIVLLLLAISGCAPAGSLRPKTPMPATIASNTAQVASNAASATPEPTSTATAIASNTAPVAHCVSPDVVGLWLRVSPSAAAAPIVALPANTPLVVEQAGAWAKVTVTDALSQSVGGYVNSDFVSECVK